MKWKMGLLAVALAACSTAEKKGEDGIKIQLSTYDRNNDNNIDRIVIELDLSDDGHGKPSHTRTYFDDGNFDGRVEKVVTEWGEGIREEKGIKAFFVQCYNREPKEEDTYVKSLLEMLKKGMAK